MTDTTSDSSDLSTSSDAIPDAPEQERNLSGEDAPLIKTFAELNLSATVLASLDAAGFLKPTPIQSKFIPVAMRGVDIMGQAKTGTGKTGAFLIPIFEQIKPGAGSSQALILAPTRELALQIYGEIGRLGSKLGFSAITLYGGASYEPQIEALAHGVDIIVGTPGRVMDHMRSQRLDLSGVKVAVLDEADRMLDLGFRKDIEYILRHCPEDRQTLLLSATIPDDIKKLSKRFMYDPEEVWTAPENLTVDSVEQHFFVCERDEKLPVLLKLLDDERPRLAIIFCGTKMGAKRLTERLARLKIGAREIHGDLQQKKREKIMSNFRTGKVKLLIATDVASRGIDVQNVTHIINYDIPYKIEDYVHRIGRTGRMERSGRAFTFVTREEGSYLTEIELLINKEISRKHYDDLKSYWWPTAPAEPLADYVLEADGTSHAEMADDALPIGNAGKGKGGRRRRRSGGRSGESRSGPPRERTGETSSSAGASEEGRSRRRSAPTQIICSQCGTTAQVRFTPDPTRPIYCPACYRAKKEVTSAAQESQGLKDIDPHGKVATPEL